jgi:hypothetical protein
MLSGTATVDGGPRRNGPFQPTDQESQIVQVRRKSSCHPPGGRLSPPFEQQTGSLFEAVRPRTASFLSEIGARNDATPDEIYAPRVLTKPARINLETDISLAQYPLAFGSESVASARRRL